MMLSLATDSLAPAVVEAGATARAAIDAPAAASTLAMTIAKAHTTTPCMPSRNSISSAVMGFKRARIRPATYPPKPKPQSETKTRKTPDRAQSHGDESRHVGAVETTDRPIAAPNASKVAEIPAATT